jgi:hypothetical protein
MGNPPLPATTHGPVNRVPCPNCGKPNNFSGQHEMLDVGVVYTCDHCKQPMQIAAVQSVKLVYVRKPSGSVSRIKRG